jgi:Predicted nucleoside-diphosphate sugar epimerases
MLVSVRVLLISIYEIFMIASNKKSKKVLIYGDDANSVAISTYLSKNLRSEYITMGFITREKKVRNFRLMGLDVLEMDDYNKLLNIIRKKFISSIIFPSQHSALMERENLVKFCLKNRIKVFIVPRLSEISEVNEITSTIREIKIEDLLGRDEIKIDMDEISSFLNNKKVMVTGGAGSIGSELARLISGFNIKQLIVFDAAETPLHNIQLELKDLEQKRLKEDFSEENFNQKFNFVIADVRARSRVESVFEKYRPDIVFHAAAYKHVPLMESNPCEAVSTNVLGTKNIADLAVKYNVEKVVMVSTDKAVNPTNVMGCSKRLAEIYVQSLSQAIIQGKVNGNTKFITTRFGNVLGSNGSVIPRFLEQIKKGGPITVTHKDIIRYFMTIPEACRLVLEAATMGEGYEIFVFDMGKPVKIADLAKNMIYLSGLVPDVDIKIEYTGLRPGEKLYEELLNDKELTIPTANEKIFVAKVRQYDYNEVETLYQDFTILTKTLENTETVKLMKKIVPEFISKNSYFHTLDK